MISDCLTNIILTSPITSLIPHLGSYLTSHISDKISTSWIVSHTYRNKVYQVYPEPADQILRVIEEHRRYSAMIMWMNDRFKNDFTNPIDEFPRFAFV